MMNRLLFFSLLLSPILAFGQSVDYLARSLSEQVGSEAPLKVVQGPYLYQDTQLESDFSQSLRNELAQALEKTGDFRVLPLTRIAQADALLEGRYFVGSRYVKIQLNLRLPDGTSLARAEVEMKRSHIETPVVPLPSSAPINPDWAAGALPEVNTVAVNEGSAGELRTVIVSGSAAGDSPAARGRALADALREAVRQGAGVELFSQSATDSFSLAYDRVFTRALGYVRSYRVLSSGLTPEGIYRVQLEAEVGPGLPNENDAVALQQLVRLSGAPRVAILAEGQVDGVPTDHPQTWFERAARQLQLNVVDLQQQSEYAQEQAVRDAILGDTLTAEQRLLTDAVDFVIAAQLEGQYLGDMREPGSSLAAQRYAFILEARALQPDGTLVAVVSQPQMEILLAAPMPSPELARPAAIDAALMQEPGGWSIFRELLTAWAVENDLGSVRSLVFTDLPDTAYQQLLNALRTDGQITAVWPRSYDRRGLSEIDIETRQSVDALAAQVLEALGQGWQFERGTDAVLQFAAATEQARALSESEEVIDSATIPVAVIPSSHENNQPETAASTLSAEQMPGWVWGLLGAGSMMLLLGVFLLGRRSF